MTQYLPSALGFSHFTPVYGTNYAEYVGLVPSTLLGNPYDNGILHQGYQGVILKPCASVFDTASSSSSVYGFATRDWMANGDADMVCSATFRLHATAGVPTFADIREWSVFARIQGGTLTADGTTGVRFSDITAYSLRLSIAGVAPNYTLVFRLHKIVAGVFSTMTASPTGTVTIPIDAGLAVLAGATFGLRIGVSGSGPVFIRTYAMILNPTTGLPTVTFPIHEATDSSSPITSFGRCGFTFGAPRNFINGKGVDLIESFEVLNGDLDVVYRDEFGRVGVAGLTAVGPDFNGVSGKPVQGRFSRDQFGPVDGGSDEICQRDTGAARLRLDLNSGATNWAAVCLDHRPVTDTTRQHRKANITLQSGSTSLGAGIILFAGQNPAATSTSGELGFTTLRGYAAVAKFTTSGSVYTVSVYRYDTAGVNKLIAQLSHTGTGPPFAVGTEFGFAFEAYPTDNQGGFPAASVTLKVYIAGVQVELNPVVGAPFGISVDDEGTVTDGGSTRVAGGFAEGLYVSGATGGKFALIDDWQELALHDPVVIPPDQPTAAFEDEGTATESLDDILSPAWSIDVEHHADHVDIEYDSGHRYTAMRFTDDLGTPFLRRTWRFESPPLNKARADEVGEFFADMLGVETAFSFTDPRTQESFKAHFQNDTFRVSKVGPRTYVASFELEELI